MIFVLGLYWGMHPTVWRVVRTAKTLGITPDRVGEWERYAHDRVLRGVA